MPTDPLDIPQGSLTLEAITDLLEAGGGDPGGSLGDAQFNNGSGIFANADGVSPGDVFNLQSGTLTMEMGTEISFGVNSAGVIVDNTNSLSLQGLNVAVTATETDINTTSLQAASQDFANTNYVIAGDVRSGHEQNIQILGANINGDFPSIIIQGR